MIRSMTAYAGDESILETWTLIWEIRTVNHRFLDLALKLPDSVRSAEAEIRSRISQRLRRGRVEAVLILKRVDSGDKSLALNRPLARQLIQTLSEIEGMCPNGLSGTSALEILKWPGVLQEAETDRGVLVAEVLKGLDRAIAHLVDAREREGEALLTLLLARLERIGSEIQKTEGRSAEILQKLRDKLRQKVLEVTDAPDMDRLEQELVHFAHRMDVAEELDRLKVHVDEMHRILKAAEPQGRRLDFLVQEMNREANTLASKSQDSETTRAAVEIKVQLEQIREQIQNIE